MAGEKVSDRLKELREELVGLIGACDEAGHTDDLLPIAEAAEATAANIIPDAEALEKQWVLEGSVCLSAKDARRVYRAANAFGFMDHERDTARRVFKAIAAAEGD